MAALAFLGTPEAAVPSLRALVTAGHDVRLVVSQPDRRRGRGGALVASPVKAAAADLGLPVTDRLDDVLDSGAELAVVVAYGRIVPQRVLDAVPMVNVHFSLLPRWRGAAPVERALLAGDEVTGVCLMRLEAGLDTGPVLARQPVAIGPDEQADELTARLARVGADLLVATLTGGPSALGAGEPQQGEPTYAAKIDPAELRIDWARPADAVVRLVRLGRAYTSFRGQRLLVLRGAPGPATTASPGTLLPVATVAAGDGGSVRLLTVQPEGRRPVDGVAWWHGARPRTDERLGEPVGSPDAGTGRADATTGTGRADATTVTGRDEGTTVTGRANGTVGTGCGSGTGTRRR